LESLLEKNWIIAEKKYDEIILQILANRGFLGTEKDPHVEEIINPSFDTGVHDPFLLPDMAKAVERIRGAKERAEKIGIFADYDADGVPGAALMFRALQKIGVDTEIYIPTRADGYGLSQRGIDYLIEKGCALIISIDLGIRNTVEAQYCQDKMVDLIITDHHLPGDKIPDAFAVINPKLEKCVYPYQNLCGCGVAYKLIQALSSIFPEISESFLKWNLDLVALSTIADMVPLTGENRVFAKYGLDVMRKSRNLGLRELIVVSGIVPSKVDAYSVGFQIGPRVNTPGRIDHAVRSYELLTTNDVSKAKRDAELLNVKNTERQKMMEKVFEESLAQINLDKFQGKVIIVKGKWERGVLGPPASRLTEKFYRPSFVFADEGDVLTGSARSVEGVHILDLIEKVSSSVEKFGGHSGAAGLTVKKESFPAFVEAMTAVSNREIDESLLVRKLFIDAELDAFDINERLYDKIDQLQPFGLGNNKPIFVLRGVTLQDTRLVGSAKNHLSLRVCKDSKRLKSIFFNFSDKDLLHGDYDVAFYLNLDTWNGSSEVCLNILDMRKHD
jgi:single-stranded-DNA-specific exonuclease